MGEFFLNRHGSVSVPIQERSEQHQFIPQSPGAEEALSHMFPASLS